MVAELDAALQKKAAYEKGGEHGGELEEALQQEQSRRKDLEDLCSAYQKDLEDRAAKSVVGKYSFSFGDSVSRPESVSQLGGDFQKTKFDPGRLNRQLARGAALGRRLSAQPGAGAPGGLQPHTPGVPKLAQLSPRAQAQRTSLTAYAYSGAKGRNGDDRVDTIQELTGASPDKSSEQDELASLAASSNLLEELQKSGFHEHEYLDDDYHAD